MKITCRDNVSTITFVKSALITSITALMLIACDGSSSQLTNCTNADAHDANTSEMTQECIADTFNWDGLERNESVTSSLEQTSTVISKNVWTEMVREDVPFALALGSDKAVLLTETKSQLHLIHIQDSLLSATENHIHSIKIPTDNLDKQLLQGVDMTADASMIIAGVLTDRNNKIGDKGTGVYVAKLIDKNSASTETINTDNPNTDTDVNSVKSNTNNINANDIDLAEYESHFYTFPNILSFAINPINNNIAIADIKGNIHILSSDLQKLAETRVYFQVDDLVFSKDGNNLFVAGRKMRGIITSEGIISNLNLNEQNGKMLDELWQWKTPDSITEIVVFDDRRVLAKPKTEPELYIVGANEKGNKGIHKTIELNFVPVNIAVNSETHTIAVSDKNNIEIINVESNERFEATTGNSIADIAFFKDTINDNKQNAHFVVATEKELINYKLP